jgi:hypothetical protein
MRITKIISWGAATTLAVGLALAGPANAAGTTGDTVVLTTNDASSTGGACTQVSYTLTGPAGQTTDANIDVTDPNGASFATDGMSSSSSQSFTHQLCGTTNAPGEYTVTVDWHVTDDTDQVVGSGQTIGTFDYTVNPAAHTRISVSKRKSGRHAWLLTSHLYRSGKSYANRVVDLQVWSQGSWTSLGLAENTNGHGKAYWTAKPPRGFGKYVFRVHFDGDTTSKASNSAHIHFAHRGGRLALTPSTATTPAQIRAELGLSRHTR